MTRSRQSWHTMDPVCLSFALQSLRDDVKESMTKRLLALDIGKKTIGLALYSPKTDVITPVETIKRTKIHNDINTLKYIIREFGVQELVIGYPLEIDGNEGRRCQATRAFVREMEQGGIALPYHYQDERHSTQIAEEAMIEATDASRQKRRAIGDAIAAQVILENYISTT